MTLTREALIAWVKGQASTERALGAAWEAPKRTAIADHFDAIAALLEAESGWQPIATAPKDGTRILATCQAWSEACVVKWSRHRLVVGTWTFDDGSVVSPYELTVWRPLPAPPTTEAGA